MRKTRSHISLSISGIVGLSAATSAVCSLLIVAGTTLTAQLSSNLTGETKGNSLAEPHLEDPNGNSGHGGSGNSSQSSRISSASFSAPSSASNPGSGKSGDCILQINKCAITDVTCLESPVFLKVSCNDSRCLEPNNICNLITTNPNGGSQSSVMPVSISPSGIGNPGDLNTTTGNSNNQSGQSNDTSNSGQSGDTHGQSGDSSGTSGNANPGSGKPQLGCFTSAGVWTTDRSACDTNQLNHLPTGTANTTTTQPSPSTPDQPFVTNNPSAGSSVTAAPTAHEEIRNDQQDSDLQSGFQTIFHTNTGPSAAVSNLLNTANTALERLQTLSSTPLPDNAKAMVDDTRLWITTLLTDISLSQPSDADVQAKADELKRRLSDTNQVVAVSIPAGTKRPDSVLKTMDHIFATLPVVFAFLQDQGAPVNLETATAYQTAANAYTSAKAACLDTANKCAQLQDVINDLDLLRSSMTSLLDQAGKTDLQGRIDEMLQ